MRVNDISTRHPRDKIQVSETQAKRISPIHLVSINIRYLEMKEPKINTKIYTAHHHTNPSARHPNYDHNSRSSTFLVLFNFPPSHPGNDGQDGIDNFDGKAGIQSRIPCD